MKVGEQAVITLKTERYAGLEGQYLSQGVFKDSLTWKNHLRTF